MQDDLLLDIKRLSSNITGLMSSFRMSSNFNNTLGVEKDISSMKMTFDKYGKKMSQYGNTADEIEWNEVTANEFVTSIRTTIGNMAILENIQDYFAQCKYLVIYRCSRQYFCNFVCFRLWKHRASNISR